MEKTYTEIRCAVVINEATGMAGTTQKDIDDATAAIDCYLSAHLKLVYLCREYAGALIVSVSPERMPGQAVLSLTNLCKAFLEGYRYVRYGQADALLTNTEVRISENLPEGYQPQFDGDDE